MVARTDAPLPEWSNIGGIVRDGLKLWFVASVWGLPSSLTLLTDVGPLGLRVLVLLVGIAAFIVEPAARVRLATIGTISAGMDVGAALRTLGRGPGGYVLLPLAAAVPGTLSLGMSSVAVWLVWGTLGGQPSFRDVLPAAITLIFVIPFPRWVIAHLEAQAYRRTLRVQTLAPDLSVGRGDEPLAGTARRQRARPARVRRR